MKLTQKQLTRLFKGLPLTVTDGVVELSGECLDGVDPFFTRMWMIKESVEELGWAMDDHLCGDDCGVCE